MKKTFFVTLLVISAIFSVNFNYKSFAIPNPWIDCGDDISCGAKKAGFNLPLNIKNYSVRAMKDVLEINFPLDKKSAKAALLANCMTYDNYHNFISTLFDRQRSWWLDEDDERLLRYAAESGLSYDEAQICLNDNRMKQDIVADREEALKLLHLTGTPALFITGPDGNEIIYGAKTYEQLKAYLDSRIRTYR